MMVNDTLMGICQKIARGDLRLTKNQLAPLVKEDQLNKLMEIGAGRFAWHIVNDTWVEPTCQHCGSKVEFRNHRREYAKYCSKACTYADPNRVKQIASTMEKKYGARNAAHVPELMEKKRQTLLDTLGVDHPSKSLIIKSQKKKTMLENWGVDNPSKSLEIQQRKIQTNRARRGVDWATQDPNVIKKNKQTCLERYGISHPRYRYNSPDQIKILTSKDLFIGFIEDKTVHDVAEALGVSAKTIYILTEQWDCRSLLRIDYTQFSSYESKIRALLDEFDIIYLTNNRNIIPPFELDIFIPDAKIAIEVGSGFWHSDRHGRDRNYHKNKWSRCKEQGITLFQWFDEDLSLNWHLTESRLKRALHIPTSVVGARKLTIGTCSHKEELEFLNKWHAKGYSIDRNSVLACRFEDMIVGIMTIKHDRKKNIATIERWATNTTKSWPGLFSKTLAHWIKTTNFKGEIKTWCDNRLGNGQVYKSSGFTEVKTSNPGYWYFKGISLENRLKFQKHKLRKLFDLSDEDAKKTEYEIMQSRGYERLWDAGHTLWSKIIY